MEDYKSLSDEALKWLGTPVLHQGRSPLGVDCVGLVVCSLRNLGFDTKGDFTNYTRRGTIRGFVKYFQDSNLKQFKLQDMAKDDILIVREAVHPIHVGIVGGEPGDFTFIHAHSTRGRVVEDPMAGRWERRRIAIFRMT